MGLLSHPIDAPRDPHATHAIALALTIGGYFVIVQAVLSLFAFQQGYQAHAMRMRRIRVANLLRASGCLDLLDTFQAISSVVLCVLYIAETYGKFSKRLSQMEHWITVFLCLDYFLRFFLATNRKVYLYSFFGATDVLTITPVLYSWAAGIETHGSATSILLRLVRLSRLIRVLRSMRFLQAKPGGGVTREVLRLGFITLTLCVVATGFMQVFENGLDIPLVGYSLSFHEAFYLIIIEVLGRPRLEVEWGRSYLFLIGVVILSILLIPRQVAYVWQIMQREPSEMRRRYKKHHEEHVVIVGCIDSAVLNLLLYEIYHPDRGPVGPCDVVILSPQPLEADAHLLLDNPAYQDCVQYLEGSSQSDHDLERARIDTASAVMVIANKFPADMAEEDTRISAIVLAAKAYKNMTLHRCGNFSSGKLRVLAQVLRSETRERLLQMPGWDVETDVCLVVGEMNAAMLTVSAIHRGLAVLMMNLISHTNQDVPQGGEQWYREYNQGSYHELYGCSIPGGSELEGRTIHDAASYLLYAYQLPLVAVKTKGELVLFPDREYRIQAGDDAFAISPNWMTLVEAIRSTRTADSRRGAGFLARQVSASFSPAASPTLSQSSSVPVSKHFRTAVSRFREALKVADPFGRYDTDFAPSTSAAISPVHRGGASPPRRGRSRRPARPASVEEDEEEEEEDEEEEENGFTDLKDMLANLYQGSFEALESDVFRLRQAIVLDRDTQRGCYSGTSFSISRTSSRRRPTHYPRRELQMTAAKRKVVVLGADVRDMCDHIVACGADAKSLVMIARTLTRRDPEQAVILLYNGDAHTIEAEAGSQGIIHTRVAIISGHLRTLLELEALHAEKARAIIVAPALARTREWGDPVRGLEHRRVIDSDTILTTNIIATIPIRSTQEMRTSRSSSAPCHAQLPVKDIWTVTQLVQDSSLGLIWGMAPEAQGAHTFVDPRWMASAPVMASPLYAAGHVVSNSTADHFIVEGFFNPTTLHLFGLLFGITGFMPTDLEDGPEASITMSQVPVSDSELLGCDTYGDLCEKLLNLDAPLLALGLFRYPAGLRSSYSMLLSLEATEELDFRAPVDSPDQKVVARLPYVVTNPPHSTILHTTDLVFVLGEPRRPAGPRGGHTGSARPATQQVTTESALVTSDSGLASRGLSPLASPSVSGQIFAASPGGSCPVLPRTLSADVRRRRRVTATGFPNMPLDETTTYTI